MTTAKKQFVDDFKYFVLKIAYYKHNFIQGLVLIKDYKRNKERRYIVQHAHIKTVNMYYARKPENRSQICKQCTENAAMSSSATWNLCTKISVFIYISFIYSFVLI